MGFKVFDYKCLNCGHIGEVWQTSDNEPIICSECASAKTEIIWLTAPFPPGGWSPYKYLDKRPPDDYNPTVSVPASYKGSPTVGRKGGKKK